MGRSGRHKEWKAWLLAAVLVFPVAVQTVHIGYHCLSEAHHTASEEIPPSHEGDTCPVCQFAFAAFTEAESLVFDRAFEPAESEPVVSFYSKPTPPVFFAYGLRAPPFV